METVNAKEGIDTMTTTTHLTKIGNAYATADLDYRVTKRDDKAWYLYIADEDRSVYLATVKTDALNRAEDIINFRKAEAALPWDRTVKRPDAMWGEKYHQSGADASDWSDYEPCQCCGRKVGKNPLYAIVVNGGISLCTLEDSAEFEKHDGGWMGCYPIGRECAKAFPAGYLTTLPQNN